MGWLRDFDDFLKWSPDDEDGRLRDGRKIAIIWLVVELLWILFGSTVFNIASEFHLLMGVAILVFGAVSTSATGFQMFHRYNIEKRNRKKSFILMKADYALVEMKNLVELADECYNTRFLLPTNKDYEKLKKHNQAIDEWRQAIKSTLMAPSSTIRFNELCGHKDDLSKICVDLKCELEKKDKEHQGEATTNYSSRYIPYKMKVDAIFVRDFCILLLADGRKFMYWGWGSTNETLFTCYKTEDHDLIQDYILRFKAVKHTEEYCEKVIVK